MKHSLHNHNNKTLLFRFVTSYSIIIILVLLLGLFFLFSVHTSSKEYTYQQNYTLFQESVDQMDNALRLLSTLTTQIGSNTSLKNLSNQTEVSAYYYNLASESMTYLTNIMALQGVLPIESFYVYLPETDRLISPTLFMDSDLFYHFEQSYDASLYEEWKNIVFSYENSHTLIPITQFQKTSSSYLYKIPLDYTNSETYHPAIACFELTIEGIRKCFDNVMGSPYALIYVTDYQGNALFTLSGNFTFETPLNELTTLVDFSSSYATEAFRENFKSYTITGVSGYNGWNYYLIQPSSYLLNDLTTYQNMYIFVILLFCALTYALIYSLSKANVKPYEAMTNRLKTSQQENVSLQDANLSLKDALERQRPLVYSAHLARIMKGQIASDQDIKEIAEFLQIKGLGIRHFFVLYVSVRLEQLEFYTEENSDAPSQSKLNEYEDMLYRCFYRYFGNDIFIYHPDVNSFALLLSSDKKLVNSPEILQDISETFRQMHNYLLEEHSLWVFGGLGGSNQKLPFFWKSYQQATEAATYTTDDCIFQSYTDLARSSTSYYYPLEMEQQLMSFIQAANDLQIAEIFKLIYRENFELRTLPEATAKWLISDIRSTLVKARYSLPEIAGCEEFYETFDEIASKQDTLDGMKQLALSFASCYKEKPQSNQLIVSIREYLEKNYYDSSLSLKKISDVFNISESYFSYLFKTETGKNFSEYLEELRMAQALVLIRETDTPISELYAHLGYNNPNSFRRAFKKVYGDSPKAFRTNSTDVE